MAYQLPRAVFLEAESTPGTAESVAGANVCEFRKWDFRIQGGAAIQRESIRPYLERPPLLEPNEAYWEVDFEIELKASTGATTAPEAGILLKAAGMTETVGGASVAYTPTDDPNASPQTFTAQWESTGISYMLHGGRVHDLTITAPSPGQPALMAGKISGGYNVPGATTTSVADSDINAGVPLVAFEDTSPNFSALGYTSWVLRGATVGFPVKYEPRYKRNCTAAQFGYVQPGLLKRGVGDLITLDIDVEPVPEATLALYGSYWRGTSTGSGQIKLAAGSRKCQIDITNLRLREAPTLTMQAGEPVVASLALSGGRTAAAAALTITFS